MVGCIAALAATLSSSEGGYSHACPHRVEFPGRNAMQVLELDLKWFLMVSLLCVQV